MNLSEIKHKLYKTLDTEKYNHSIKVMNVAVELAEKNGVDTEKARLAGLLHDCAKNMKDEELLKICMQNNIELDEVTRRQPKLLHGAAGGVIAVLDYEIDDREILDAIANHTMGKPDMSMLSKIIFISDYIEEDRDFEGVEYLRKKAFKELDSAIVLALDGTIKKLLGEGALLHTQTVETRNFYLIRSNPHIYSQNDGLVL